MQHAVLKSAIEETKDAMRAREAADEHEKTVAAARAEFDSKYKLDPGLDSQESPGRLGRLGQRLKVSGFTTRPPSGGARNQPRLSVEHSESLV